MFYTSISSFYETHYLCPVYRSNSLTIDHAALQCFYSVGALKILTIVSGGFN